MSKKKPLWEMTTDELAAATGEFDSEIAAKTFGSPTAKQRAQLARAKKKRGRPPIGKGVCVISVSIEKDLLRGGCVGKTQTGKTRRPHLHGPEGDSRWAGHSLTLLLACSLLRHTDQHFDLPPGV